MLDRKFRMHVAALKLSVIIPTYNRCRVLIEALKALSSQQLSFADFEVIVADDGSVDGTGDAVRAFANDAPMSVIYSWERNKGANAARNRAIAQASGAVLVIINDDTVATPDFLARHLAAHEAHPAENVAVLGRVTISPEVPYSLFADLHLDGCYKVFEGQRELDWKAFFTCNLSVKAEFLRKYGLFEERLRWHEDVELGERLARNGLKVIYEPAALGFHLHHLQEKDYLGVAAREGASLAEWYCKDPSLLGKLGEVGFHPAAGIRKRSVYWLADRLFNPAFYPFFVGVARVLSDPYPNGARALYRKLFQARKRQAARSRLKQLRRTNV